MLRNLFGGREQRLTAASAGERSERLTREGQERWAEFEDAERRRAEAKAEAERRRAEATMEGGQRRGSRGSRGSIFSEGGAGQAALQHELAEIQRQLRKTRGAAGKTALGQRMGSGGHGRNLLPEAAIKGALWNEMVADLYEEPSHRVFHTIILDEVNDRGHRSKGCSHWDLNSAKLKSSKIKTLPLGVVPESIVAPAPKFIVYKEPGLNGTGVTGFGGTVTSKLGKERKKVSEIYQMPDVFLVTDPEDNRTLIQQRLHERARAFDDFKNEYDQHMGSRTGSGRGSKGMSREMTRGGSREGSPSNSSRGGTRR